MAAGYSGTPLARKLGIKPASRVLLVNAPAHLPALLAPLPDGVQFGTRPTANTDLVHVFTTQRAELQQLLAQYREKLSPQAVVWVSWPKKAAKMATEVTEDTIRELALPLGWVDIKARWTTPGPA